VYPEKNSNVQQIGQALDIAMTGENNFVALSLPCKASSSVIAT